MSESNHKNILLFAIGNNGRQDDGLGWAFGEALEQRGAFRGEIHYRYQLQVEDAELIAGADEVIFVDAFKGKLPGGCQWKRVEPSANFEFTTHALSPEAVLFWCEKLYEKTPEAYCLLMAGEAWELGIGLTLVAEKNMESALEFFKKTYLNPATQTSPERTAGILVRTPF
ncbi:MAG: hydrogenase maturation protease [Saprospiraceae bacterium]|nr:hydrogenase maturation protease [Saprospiraceae bacterium]